MSIFDQICSAVGSDFVDGQTVNQQYQPPQQRTWVGLNNDDWIRIYNHADKSVGRGAELAEEILKEKNT